MNADERVYQLLPTIPRGKVTTYGTIGKKLGLNPRHVGRILRHNPNAPHVPCHRVVKGDRTLASGYRLRGAPIQRQLLESEGVVFQGAKIEERCILRSI